MLFINSSSIVHPRVSINLREHHGPSGKALYFHEAEHVVWGFSGENAPLEDVEQFVHHHPLLMPDQVHGAVILDGQAVFATDVTGDGILLRERGHVAVIQTADCTPLFFWHPQATVGGILHVGWRGLQQGITAGLARLLKLDDDGWSGLRFYLGPAIESRCYEVGPEVYDLFAALSYRDTIFTPLPGQPKFYLDIAAGIVHSLLSLGVERRRIMASGICTRCDPRLFPSYRREGASGKRIYNFMLFKPGKEIWYG